MRIFRLLYAAALRTLPRAFRDEHGPDAMHMAAARVAEEAGARRFARAARELADLLISAPRIRREAGRAATPFFRHEGHMLEAFLSDLRYASRALLRTRGFLAVALTTLGAGIALAAAVTVLVNVYLVRGLPYPQSERLHWIWYGQPGAPFAQGLEHVDWSTLDDIIEHPISWDLDLFNLRGAPYPEAAQGTWVTRGYMAAFGVAPAIGRAFFPSDFDAAGPPVALISHRLWQTRFGGDPAIVGRTFETFNNDRPDEPRTFTVVGVLPERLWHLNVFTEILAPLRAPSFPYMARLRPGVSPETAVTRVESLVRASDVTLPDGWGVRIVSAHAQYVEQTRPVLISLGAATALVLLIAIANVAVLFTVRATHRRREIAVRKALGASGAQITRTLASEALVVGAAATVIGLALAQAVISAAAPFVERSLGRTPGGSEALRIDGLTVTAVIVAGLLVTLVCGGAQLLAARMRSATGALGGGERGATGGPQQRRAQSALIAIEVAACLALLAGAALMVQSGLRILNVDMGLRPDGVLAGRISLSRGTYPDSAARAAAYDRVSAAIAGLDGVRDMAFASSWPLQPAPARQVGRDEPGAELQTRAGLKGVSTDFFKTLDIAIDDGRAFTADDRIGAQPVAIVSRSLAQRLWPGRRAVGARLRVGPPETAPDEAPESFLVVGVAEDVRHAHTDEDLTDVYLAGRQYPSPAPFMYVRAGGLTPRLERDIRDALAGVDPDMALGTPRPLAEILEQQRAGTRFLTTLLMIFAFFAAVLALMGVYGVIAYTVRQREREIALRLAIGADRAIITRLFVRQGAAVLAVGSAMGVAAALLLGRLLESQLFGVQPADPAALAAVTIGFAACGLAAITLPARAAASIDPALALKE